MDSLGSGIWWTIHIGALKATTRIEQERFCDRLISEIESLPCPTCTGHALDYMKSNNIHDYIMKEDGIVKPEYSIFRYTVDFHNSVNMRLQKPNVALITAYNHYLPRITTGVYPSSPYIIEESEVITLGQKARELRRPDLPPQPNIQPLRYPTMGRIPYNISQPSNTIHNTRSTNQPLPRIKPPSILMR